MLLSLHSKPKYTPAIVLTVELLLFGDAALILGSPLASVIQRDKLHTVLGVKVITYTFELLLRLEGADKKGGGDFALFEFKCFVRAC